jgi:Activator of Hsp90 ATPase homolog 1-like protein
MTEPLRLSYDVACPAEHAFDVWTRRIDAWWPADHTATGEDGLEVVLEPRVGGRIYQRDPRGTEVDWGEVTLWDPPEQLGYLWHLRRDRADATDVLITFRRWPRTRPGWTSSTPGGSDWAPTPTAGGTPTGAGGRP